MYALRTCSQHSRKNLSDGNTLATNLDAYLTNRRVSKQNEDSSRLFKTMKAFALVFEINEELGQPVVDCLRDAAFKIVNALEFEDRRTRYVVAEAKTMLQKQDELLQRYHDTHQDPHGKNVLVLDDHMTLALIFQHSSLARLFKHIFHSINEGVGVTACVVNSCTRFALNPLPVEPPPQRFSLMICQPFQTRPTTVTTIALINSIRRYHTMVLRMDLEATQIEDLVTHLFQLHPYKDGKGVTEANAPQTKMLSTFITGLNPLKSFEQLHVEMGLQLRQCFEIAAHLVYWKVGVVIKTLSRANRYCKAPSGLSENAYVAKAFALRFAPLEISPFLVRIGSGVSLGDFIDHFKKGESGEDKLDPNDQKVNTTEKLTHSRLIQIIVFLLGA